MRKLFWGLLLASTAELEARLEALRKSRDSGVLTVRHGETTTTFRTLSEMERIIATLESQIRSGKAIRTVRVYSEGGW